MSKAQHTPEPWIYRFWMGEEWPAKRCSIVSVDGNALFINARFADDKYIEANAKRIVACVNACEGISTEALEGGIVKELLEELENISTLSEEKRLALIAKAKGE